MSNAFSAAFARAGITRDTFKPKPAVPEAKPEKFTDAQIKRWPYPLVPGAVAPGYNAKGCRKQRILKNDIPRDPIDRLAAIVTSKTPDDCVLQEPKSNEED